MANALFIKSFGGKWVNKDIPVTMDMMKKRAQLMHKKRLSLQFTDQYLEQFKAFAMKARIGTSSGFFSVTPPPFLEIVKILEQKDLNTKQKPSISKLLK